MRELADNVLDIAQNSIAAQARLIQIRVIADVQTDRLTLEIADDGKGMSPELLARVTDPFTTTRTTRKVGLGLPLLKMTASMTGGDFSIDSTLGKGTTVRASFGLTHIDRPPMGDLAGTLFSLVLLNEQIDFVIECVCNDDTFQVDTREIKKTVAPLPLSNPDVSAWLKEYLEESIYALYGGVLVL